jgi:tetratricopeptide (TPR) repeat protein
LFGEFDQVAFGEKVHGVQSQKLPEVVFMSEVNLGCLVVIAGIVFASVLIYCARLSTQRRILEPCQRANEAIAKLDYDLAIACCNETLRSLPTYAIALRIRGTAYSCKMDYSRALADFTQCIQLDTEDSGEGYRLRGDVHLKVGTIARAIGRPSTEGDPLALAVADYSDAIRLNPKDALAHRQRACAYVAKGDVEQAIAGFTEALRLDPMDAESFCGRAEVYAATERKHMAEEDFRAALRVKPTLERAAKGLAALSGQHASPADPEPIRSEEVRIYRQSG